MSRLDGRLCLRVRIDIPGHLNYPERGLTARMNYTHHWQTVISSEAPKTCPVLIGLQARPKLTHLSTNAATP